MLRARSYLLAPVKPPMHASFTATQEGEECVRSQSIMGKWRHVTRDRGVALPMGNVWDYYYYIARTF